MTQNIRRVMTFSDDTMTKVIQAWIDVIGSIKDDHNRAAIQKFTEDMKERLFSSPASPSVNYAGAHNCMPLGFVEHTLRVYKNFRRLVNEHKATYDFPHEITDDDVIIAALFHDMGKIGDLDEPYYLEQPSDWHRDRGMFYQMNDKIEYLKIPLRALFMLQQYGVTLPIHVYKAILLHDGPAEEANRAYTMREGLFAMLLQHADQLAAMYEIRRYQQWEEKNS